jgi:protein gp37
MDVAWATDLRDQCQKAAVPFFFKQWGGKNKKKAGRLLEDRTWDEMPRVARSELPRDVRRLSVVA